MNNLFKSFAFALSLAFVFSLASFNVAKKSNPANDTEEALGVSFLIKNNTGSSVRLYDGKGHFTINNGSAKRVNVEAGRKYYISDKGKKGNFLFEVESGFSGKTIKLSDYM